MIPMPAVVLLLLGASGSEQLDASDSIVQQMDRALAATASLVRAGALSAVEEDVAVGRILNGDPSYLLLAKHFGAMPSFVQHLRHAAGATGAPSTSAAQPMDPLVARRSVVKYRNSSALPEGAVRRALEAAILAPNHFLSEPWRFYQAGAATREALVALNPAKHDLFTAVPHWMVVTVVVDSGSEPEGPGLATKRALEDYAATACAVQNFMLSLARDGVGTKWMTGALGAPPEAVLRAVGVDEKTERLVGAIWYGVPETPLSDTTPPPPRKKGVDGVLTQLP